MLTRPKYTVKDDEEPTRVSVQADALGRMGYLVPRPSPRIDTIYMWVAFPPFMLTASLLCEDATQTDRGYILRCTWATIIKSQ